MKREERPRGTVFALAILLAALTWIVYGQTSAFGFVRFDDDEYVYANRVVTAGLTLHGIAESFRFRSGNWHPLAWMSHMADVQLFGMNPGAHHLVNVLLHAANATLLFLVLRRLTAATGRSAIVAAFFAVHPLNVENVAWISERKTLLSVMLLFAVLLAWESWVRMPSAGRLAVVTGGFVLALMAKPYVIMLPVLLLVLDFWPLDRLGGTIDSVRDRLVEKLPLIACAAVSALLTFRAQLVEGAVAAAQAIPAGARLLNALASTAWYLGKLACPTRLSFYYPHPTTLGRGTPVAMAVAGAILIMLLGAAAFVVRKRAPFVTAGIAWYFVALVPVIGIVQVGLQARADRYAYLPMIGILTAVVWAGEAVLARLPRGGVAGAIAATIAVAVLIHAARAQASLWRNSESLFSHAAELDAENWAAWQGLGVVALERGDVAGALSSFERAWALYDGNALVSYDIGYVHSLRDEPMVALEWYRRTLQIKPDDVRTLAAMALTYLQIGDVPNAMACSKRAIAVAPESPDALYGIALVSRSIGDGVSFEAALKKLRVVVPELAEAVSR